MTVPDPQDVTDETLIQLGSVSTATLTTQLLRLGLRNTFLFGLRPLGQSRRFVGPAYTLRYIPAREDIDVVEAFRNLDHPQRSAIERIPPGNVLVMDCRNEGRAASGGEILLTRLMVRGCAGVVTDGSVRDSHRIAELDLPVYTGNVSAMTNLALHHAVDTQQPVGCAGVAVYPGDIMVADAEGVVCIPRHLAGDVAQAAFDKEHLEEFLLHRVRKGAELSGTYPPNEQTLKDYDTWRHQTNGQGKQI